MGCPKRIREQNAANAVSGLYDPAEGPSHVYMFTHVWLRQEVIGISHASLIRRIMSSVSGRLRAKISDAREREPGSGESVETGPYPRLRSG